MVPLGSLPSPISLCLRPQAPTTPAWTPSRCRQGVQTLSGGGAAAPPNALAVTITLRNVSPMQGAPSSAPITEPTPGHDGGLGPVAVFLPSRGEWAAMPMTER